MRGLLALALLGLIALSVVAQALSDGPPAKTVLDTNGCTCHGQNPNSGTVVTATAPATYVGGQTYGIQVTSTTNVVRVPPGTNDGGFLAWASKGTLQKQTGSPDWYKTGTEAGGSWISHNLKGDQENGGQSWRFDWKAPSAGTGTVTLKVFVNRVNGDGSNSELDFWNRATKTITESASTSQPPGTSSPPKSTSASPTTGTPPSSEGGGGIPAGPVLALLGLVAAAAAGSLRRR